MYKLLIFLCLCYLSILPVNSQNTYELIFATDFNGETTKGSKKKLIELIQQGKPVRVGWQLDFNKDDKADLEHWIDAEFITIIGSQVFTQIETIFAQGPNLEKEQVEIGSDATKWTGVIGTNGKLLNRYIMDKPPQLADLDGNPIEDQEMIEKQFKEMTKVGSMKVATFWSVLK